MIIHFSSPAIIQINKVLLIMTKKIILQKTVSPNLITITMKRKTHKVKSTFNNFTINKFKICLSKNSNSVTLKNNVLYASAILNLKKILKDCLVCIIFTLSVAMNGYIDLLIALYVEAKYFEIYVLNTVINFNLFFYN